MLAAVFKSTGAPLVVEQVADPVPQQNELVIAVGACGICGTDLHWTENRDTSGGWRELTPGGILGHEFAGEITEVGANAKSQFRVGDIVCALPFIGCGRCAACLSGRVFRCASVDTRATPTLAGAYAQYARVGVAETVRLPAGMDVQLGALIEPLAVGLAAAERAQFSPGASVLVMGAGPVGLSVAMWCRFLGAGHVIVSDRVYDRASRAAEFGATDMIDAAREPVTERLQAIAGGAPQVVFDCVGVAGTMQSAVEYVANDGCVVVAGLCMGADQFLPAVAVVKAIDLRFTMCYEKRHFEVIVDLIARGRIDVSRFITQTVSFAGFAEKFEQLKTAGADIKVLLQPHSACGH